MDAARLFPGIARHRRVVGAWLVLFVLLLCVAGTARAQAFPTLSGRVVDAADVIPDALEAQLTAKLAALEARNGRQFVIATIPYLEGVPIADYGYRLGRHWGIGRAKIDDGLLLIIAPNDREVRIEVGGGLTPVVTDALAAAIIDGTILPEFREDRLADGIEHGAERLIEIVSLPDAQGQARAAQIIDDAKTPLWLIIVAILFWGGCSALLVGYFGYVFLRVGKESVRDFGRWRRGERVSTWSSSGDGSSRSSFSSSGSSGSSSSSFSGGGGSFSGGGASGSW